MVLRPFSRHSFTALRVAIPWMIANLLVANLFAANRLLATPPPIDPSTSGGVATSALPFPILFVTQVPIPADFATVGSVFANHLGDMDRVGRVGDLWILYPNGTLKNLTLAAGFGMSGFQGEQSIAVREPSVHWSGTKALFSMVTGSPQQYQWEDYYWQIYEIQGLGQFDTPSITHVSNQPSGYNNVSPFYGTDDRILFTSDRPRSGAAHLHPQRDEYESTDTITGLWSLDPSTGDLRMLNHTPSGVFSPSIDSFGRLIFTRWDHLQRDQQADADEQGGGTYGSFNWSGEDLTDVPLESREELFPEPRPSRTDLLEGTNLVGHTFNQFFPWQINEDGTDEETLNHLGRHEMLSYFEPSFDDDPNLDYFAGNFDDQIRNVLQLKESPLEPGTCYGIDAPEFYTHACGQVIRVTAPEEANADDLSFEYVSHRETANFTDNPGPNHTGLYRNPVPLSDGTVLCVHTPETRSDYNEGTRAFPLSRYDLRMKRLVAAGAYWQAGAPLTPGISKTVSYWDPDVLVSYSGELWELDPVEVRPRNRPALRVTELPSIEAQVFAEENVPVEMLEEWMRARDLALVISRNVTVRDDADRQQPFNLRVPGGAETIGAQGKIYDLASLQFFQGDLIRGYGGTGDPSPGRRVLAQPMHDPAVNNPANPGGPEGSVHIAADGSMAAFLPARRAMTWQSTDGAGVGVVRERYWVTFQPGEIRTCHNCHGVNREDQAGEGTPTNEPLALHEILQHFRALTGLPSENPGAVAGVSLLENMPNPLVDRTELRIVSAAPLQRAVLEVWDVEGRVLVREALGPLLSGFSQVSWMPRDADGRALRPGIYFYRVGSEGRYSDPRKVSIVR